MLGVKKGVKINEAKCLGLVKCQCVYMLICTGERRQWTEVAIYLEGHSDVTSMT